MLGSISITIKCEACDREYTFSGIHSPAHARDVTEMIMTKGGWYETKDHHWICSGCHNHQSNRTLKITERDYDFSRTLITSLFKVVEKDKKFYIKSLTTDALVRFREGGIAEFNTRYEAGACLLDDWMHCFYGMSYQEFCEA